LDFDPWSNRRLISDKPVPFLLERESDQVRMPSYCLECGGELKYDPAIKQYSCKSCGLTFSSQDLLKGRDQMVRPETDDDAKKRRHKEYLKWWLSGDKTK